MTDARPSHAAGRWSRAGLLGLAWTYLAAILVGHYGLDTAKRHQVETAWFILAGLAILVVLWSSGRQTTRQDAPAAPFSPLAAASAIVVSMLLFARSLWIGPLSDDYTLLEIAPGLSGGWEFFRPLPLALWSIVHPALGALGLHAINIALHGLNAALVYRFVVSVSPGSGRAHAFAGAAAFLTFPAAVEAVTWSAGIFDVALVTCSLLFLTSLLNDTSRARTMTIAAFVAAVLCKETAAALPMLGWALSFRQRVDRRALVVVTVVAIMYAAVRLLSARVPAVDAPMGYFLKEMVVRPFAALGVPWTSSEIVSRPFLLGVLPNLVVAALVVGYALRPTIGIQPLVPLVWVVAAIAPLMGSFFVTADLEGSRYVYLPLVGWAWLLTELASYQTTRTAQRLALAGILALAGGSAYGSWRHQTAWVEAARLRDQVLAEAREVMARTSCESAVFSRVPDTLAGAFVFRNGFVEAARTVGLKVELAPSERDAGRCQFEWTETGFAAVAPRPSNAEPRT